MVEEVTIAMGPRSDLSDCPEPKERLDCGQQAVWNRRDSELHT